MIRFAPFVGIAAALFAGGCTESSDLTATHAMTLSGNAFAPPAFYSFCANQPSLCRSSGSVRTLKLTAAREAELRSVNQSVNARIHEVADATAGRGDKWSVPSKSGDCEDFAILKKKELLSRGWPASTLLLTAVTYGGAGHTVLTVRTDKGDLILDNRTNAVKEWTRTPYKYFARQSQSATGQWTRIGA